MDIKPRRQASDDDAVVDGVKGSRKIKKAKA